MRPSRAPTVVQIFEGCHSDAMVYQEPNRRKGIASVLYHLIEDEVGRPLQPSRIRSAAGRKSWASRRGI
jgi:hypothetical protein